jgi:hypothetical protein
MHNNSGPVCPDGCGERYTNPPVHGPTPEHDLIYHALLDNARSTRTPRAACGHPASYVAGGLCALCHPWTRVAGGWRAPDGTLWHD